MAAPREDLFVQLLAKLTALVGTGDDAVLRYASRALLSWDDCPPAMCPAAFLVAAGESHTKRRGLPSLVLIHGQIIVYAKNDQGRDQVPATQLNNLISAVEDTLKRTPQEGPAPSALFPQNPDLTFGTTLGGLCYTCQIGPSIDIFEGFQGADAVAIIPVEMWTTERP